MTTIYLARHGETEDNVNKIMQGQTQGRLTERGVEQAERLAEQLSQWGIEAIISSDLRRAKHTAQIVADRLRLTVDTSALLRERDWGSFTGRHIPSLADEPWPSDIESLPQLLSRAKAALTHISAQYEGKAVLVVGHGIINKAMQAVYHGKPMAEIPRMDNAEVRILRV